MTANHIKTRRRGFAIRNHNLAQIARRKAPKRHQPPFDPLAAAVLATSLDPNMRRLGKLALEIDEEAEA
jgi:hypothetical protein